MDGFTVFLMSYFQFLRLSFSCIEHLLTELHFLITNDFNLCQGLHQHRLSFGLTSLKRISLFKTNQFNENLLPLVHLGLRTSPVSSQRVHGYDDDVLNIQYQMVLMTLLFSTLPCRQISSCRICDNSGKSIPLSK